MFDSSKINLANEEASSYVGKVLLVLGICLTAVFFLPWAVYGDFVFFSWDLFDHPVGSVSFLLVWLLLSGIAAIVVGLIPRIPAWVRGLVAVFLGLIPLLVMFAAIPDAMEEMREFRRMSIGSFAVMLPLSMLLLAFGCVYWSAKTDSILARVIVGFGLLFCLLAFLIPVKFGFGRYSESIVPLGVIFKGFGEARGVGIILLIYLLLGFLASFASVLVFPPVTDEARSWARIRWARILGLWYTVFLPGFFLFVTIGMWVNEKAAFFPIYIAVIIIAYFYFVVVGGGVLAAQGASKLDEWTRASREQATLQPHASPPPAAHPPHRPAAPAQPPVAPQAGIEQRLMQLRQLLEKGLITPQEFEQKKKELISSL